LSSTNNIFTLDMYPTHSRCLWRKCTLLTDEPPYGYTIPDRCVSTGNEIQSVPLIWLLYWRCLTHSSV